MFENTAKAPVRPSSNQSQGKGDAASQKPKFQLTKKGKPYQKFGKDNSTLRMTREKYFEVMDAQDVRRMRMDYEKLN